MKFKNEKGVTLVALVLIIILLVIITSVIVVVVVNNNKNENSEQSNSTVDNTTTPDNEQDKQSTEYYSILDHLPEFSETQKDPSTILWISGIPLNANPLTYQNGLYVTGLYYYNDSYFSESISLSAEEISNIKINDENTNISKYSGAFESNDLYFCRLDIENSEGETYLYSPISYKATANEWNPDYLKNEDFTLGEVFANGLFTSTTKIYDLAEKQGINSNNLSAQECLNFLIEQFGNPSGLYWCNSIECVTRGLDEYTTFEEFKNGNKNSTDKRTKEYYLVWDYGDCYITARLYENPAASSGPSSTETSIDEISLFQKVDNYEAFRNDSPYSVLIDGYIGYGQAPGQLRYKGSPLSATE